MKILFDHQIFYKKLGGASKYFVKMIEALPAEIWSTTVLFPINEYARETGIMKTYKKFFRGQPILLDYINRPYTNRILLQQRFDIFHQTNFGTYCLKSLCNKPMVTTYHDANLSTIDPHPEIVKMQIESVKRADKVIVVSENTKNDLLRFFDVDEKKVQVIYHGIDIPSDDKFVNERLFLFPYILYVGRRSKYKNFSRFIEAFSLIHHKYPDLKVVCTFNSFSDGELQMFNRFGVREKILHIEADEKLMLQLYHQALFFVFPSLYEGFGMPILEAWACGCPVLLSEASCFPEIAADAGLYFNPESEEDISEKMCMALDDEKLLAKLADLGKKRVLQFSWQRCATQHMKLYESLL
ncbi:MAG: glycosyltransferase family 4 protein [Prevotella sp.]|nr:glycosyltransferase family 4 protein [Prevotella sp.]